MDKYTIIRDNQEKSNYWTFNANKYCDGTICEHLVTGDYTIRGLEDKFTIERKANTGEFSGNITKARFERELSRMDKLDHSFLILEFTLEDMYSFPYE